MKNLIILLLFFIIISAPVSTIKPQNYDYLIITPDLFIHNTGWYNELIDLQRSRGFNPKLALITDHTTTMQLKDLIEEFYETNPLEYVLFMGSAKNISLGDPDTSWLYEYTPHGLINCQVDYLKETYIPFCAVNSQNPWNPTGWVNIATDDPYVDSLTRHGDVYIGRVPVISVTEAENYVNKLRTYYQSLYTYSDFKKREIILNLDVTYSNGCSGELVRDINQKLINDHMPDSISLTVLNVSEHTEGCSPHFYCYEREKLFEDALNQGASIVTLLATIGGPINLGGWYWDSSSFNIWNKNKGIPFLLAPNCHQGEVNNPDYLSTMRMLMVHPDGGIIGTIAPTEGSEQHENGYFLFRVHDLIYQDETLNYSKIFKILKNEFFNKNHHSYDFFYNGLTFFGDPTLVPSVRTIQNPVVDTINKYDLLGNYPNPFNPGTNISFTLPYQSSGKIIIYNTVGETVREFELSAEQAGYKSIWWDGKNENGNYAASGIYIYSLELKSLESNDNFVKSAKMLLLK